MVQRAFDPKACGKEGVCVPDPETKPLLKSAGGAKTSTSCRPAVGKVQEVLNDYHDTFLSKCRAPPTGLFSQQEADITNREKESRGKLFNAWPSLQVDCLFGSNTKKATKAFQAAVFQDPKEWDGVVGDKTWHAIDEFERRRECFLTAKSVTSGKAKKQTPRKVVGVRITTLVGGSGTAERDIKTANEIYAQANVKVVVKGAPVHFDLPTTESLIGPDLIVDEGTQNSPEKPTAEQRAVITSNDEPGSITAYYATLSRNDGFAWVPSSGQPHAFIVSSSESDTLAHELAHILLNDEGHHTDRNNFMADGGGNGQNMMDTKQIKKIRDGNSFVK